MIDQVKGEVSRDKYVKARCAHEMTRYRGRKRLRKKKAVAALRRRWGFLQMGEVIRRRLDYAAVGRKAFSVEPLPVGALPIYDKDPNVTKVVTGHSKEGEE